jgi:hypothetical protein
LLTTKLIGALFVFCGLLYMAGIAVYRGQMSEPHSSNDESAGLEPRHRGLRFLGLKANWPGLVVAAVGAVMLLLPSA